MTRTTVQAGFDTWAGSANPAQPHGDEKSLHVATGAEVAYVHFAKPAPRGATVLSATLTLFAKGDSTGTRTLTARLITEGWKANTLNWRNRPAASNAGAVPITVHALSDKDAVDFDVTALVQAVVTGTAKNYGFSITSSGSDHRFYSAQSGKPAVLVVHYSEKPAQPTQLRPGGGLVGVAQPTLQWEYGGGEDLASYQIQADPASSEALPAYDSGVVPATDPIHALEGTAFNQLDVDGGTTFWRVCVTDAGGDTSDWSDWVQITRDDKGTLTLLNPAVAPNDYVTEPTPPILFELDNESLAAFRVLLTPAADRTRILHDSRRVAGTVGEYTLPLAPRHNGGGPLTRPLIVSGQTYSVGVMAWDAKKRQGSSAAGDEPYQVVWRDFTMTDDVGVTAPALVSAAQDGFTPAVLLEWTRGTAPDSFVILRDGIEIVAQLDPIDALVSGTTYRLRDWSAHPGAAHVYELRAVVNGVQSHPSNAVTVTGGTHIEGLWVIDPDSDRYFVVAGTSVSDWKQVEVGTTYWPIDGQTGFRVTQVLAGLAGTFDGFMRERAFRSVPLMEADLWAMKQDAPHSDGFRLVADTMNIPVQVYEVSCAVSEDSMDGYPRRRVTFGFRQTGEFEFEGRV